MSYLFGLVIFIIAFSIVKNNVLNIFENIGVILSVSLLSIIITFLIVVVLSLIFTTFKMKKLTNKKIRDLTQSWE